MTIKEKKDFCRDNIRRIHILNGIEKHLLTNALDRKPESALDKAIEWLENYSYPSQQEVDESTTTPTFRSLELTTILLGPVGSKIIVDYPK